MSTTPLSPPSRSLQAIDLTQIEAIFVGGSKKFLCPQCSSPFSLKGSLGRHMRTVHLIGSPPAQFTCDCGSSYNRKDNLKQHMKKMGHTAKGFNIAPF